MNKNELINAVAKKTGLQVKQTKLVCNGIFEELSNVMAKKDKVSIVGFGTFGATKRAARDGVNPSTGEKLRIPGKVVPTFKAGKKLKEIVR